MKYFYTLVMFFGIMLMLSLYAYAPIADMYIFIHTQLTLMLELLVVGLILMLIQFIKIDKWRRLMTGVIFSIFFMIYTIQLINVDITGNVLTMVSLNTISQIQLVINKAVIIKVLIYLCIYFVILMVLIKKYLFQAKMSFIAIFVLLASYISLIQYKHSETYSKTIYYTEVFSPIKDFYALAKAYILVKNKKSVTTLNPKDIDLAKKFNIYIDMNSSHPFKKNTLYTDTLPFKQIQNTQPNVIVFFVESFSARLLGSYKNTMHTVTPTIDNFAAQSMSVKGYYNHATPTAPGLYGQHCSLYPLLTYNDMNKEVNPLSYTQLKCMPSYFKDNGYQTTYISHTRKYHSHIGENLKIWGYDDTILYKDVLNKYLNGQEPILGVSGLSDHQMMQSIVNHLKSKPKKPFLLGISTIETHIGLTPNSIDGIHYKDGSNHTLNMMHNFDDAFKIFWKYFKTSEYFNNTIVVLTGDHALYPNTDFQKVAGKTWIPSVYDELGLIIYDPHNHLPSTYKVNANSADLAPTLIHLAGLKKESSNTFIGTSIFDTKAYNNSFGISAYNDFNYYVNIDGKTSNKKIKFTQDSQLKETYHTLKKVLQYSQYLRENGKY